MTHKCLRSFGDLFCLFPLILICGCGGSSSPSVTPPQASEFVYVPAADQSILGFQIDSTGQLSVIPGSPFKVPGSPFKAESYPTFGLSSDPQSRFLLAGGTDRSDSNSTVYVPARISETHALTFTPALHSPSFGASLMDPMGRFVIGSFYASLQNGVPNLIHVYSITDDLSFPEVPTSPFQPDVFAKAIDPAGKFIFAAEGAQIDTLQISASGALTKTASTYSYEPIYFDIHPSGRFLYVRKLREFAPDGYDLDVYRIDASGALTLSTTEQNFANSFVAFHPSGNFVYSFACVDYPCSLEVLPIDSTTGAISSSPTYSLAQWSAGYPVLDSTGARLFALSGGDDCSKRGQLIVFSVGIHGQLQSTGTTATTGPCPNNLVVTQ